MMMLAIPPTQYKQTSMGHNPTNVMQCLPPDGDRSLTDEGRMTSPGGSQ